MTEPHEADEHTPVGPTPVTPARSASALATIVEAGALVAAHRPWPRVQVDEAIRRTVEWERAENK